MQVTKSTIFQLFQMEKRHLVPLFQRPYVWNEGAQWTPLWENIRDKAEEVVAQETGLSFKAPSLHFLGAIVRSPFQTTGNQVGGNLLIDGQQRLTTLQIILMALRDYGKAHPDCAAAGQNVILKMMTENMTALDPDQPQERFKVWPTNADRPDLLAITQAGTPDELKSAVPLQKAKHKKKYTPRPLLVDAYLFFYEKITTYIEVGELGNSGDEESPKMRFAALVKALQNYMELVVIDLEGDEDPQIIFETLNARGAKLLPSDLVRNFVFWDAAHKGEKPDELHKKYWEPYDVPADGFWKQEQQQGRVRRPRIDLFLFQYLVYQTRNEVSITDLFNVFRKWWQKESHNVEAELQKMQHFSHVFRELMASTTDSRFGVFARRIRILDAGTLYPLLLFLKGENHLSLNADDLDRIVIYLESYLVRRMVCGLTTKRYNLIFLRLLQELAGTDEFSPMTVADQLANLQGDSSRWPDDTEFRTAWLTRPVYQTLPHSRLTMVLSALDLQLTTTKQIKVHIDGPVTVEHVLPQSWNEVDWPLTLNASGLPVSEIVAAQDKAKMERNVLLHTFGNLTLLSQPLNSSVSNSPYNKKQPSITQDANLRLNAYFHTVPDVWDEAAIRARGEELFQTALKIWPKP